MSFFVTSVNPGKGGDLGGLAGADAYCNTLATAAGVTGKTWKAYLSPLRGTQVVELLACDAWRLHGQDLQRDWGDGLFACFAAN